jgi:hypothetical protein
MPAFYSGILSQNEKLIYIAEKLTNSERAIKCRFVIPQIKGP